MPAPPERRLPGNPWPEWPNVRKTDYGQEEAIDLMGEEMRSWGVDTLEVLLDEAGAARGLRVADLDWTSGRPERLAGSERELPAQLVLIACGFTGPERGVFDAFGVAMPAPGEERPLPRMVSAESHRCELVGTAAVGASGAAESVVGASSVPAAAAIYAAGDAHNGSSLVVNAIADALACAAEVAEYLEL